jgi:HK97 family phage portal protein
MMSPPDRNTAEFLDTYAHSPRLSPVTKIATDLSSVQGKLYRVKPDGDKDEINDHPFLDFMKRPNPLPFMTRSALWKLQETYLLIKGEGAAIIERDAAGYPAELWPIPPHWMIDIPRLDYPFYIVRSRDGLQCEVPAADMFLMRQLNPLDPYARGLGDAEPVADEIETDEYMAKWAKKFFYNDATPPALLSAPGITKDEYDRFQAAWNDRHRGLGNAHKIGILPRDVTVQKLVDSQREMDFTESRKNLRDGVNAHFGVPPEILGIVENSNRATATQAKIIYAENVLTPRLLARQDAINMQLLAAWGEDLLWEFDDIVPEDTEFRLQMSNAGLQGSALMVDEWREQNGFEPLPNDAGKVLFVPFASMPTKPEELTESARQTVTSTPTSETLTPEATATPGPSNAPQGEDAEQLAVAKDIALNGAQVTSLVQIARSVALGELDRTSAVEIITAAFPFDKEKAEQIIGDAGSVPMTPEQLAGIKANNRRRQQAAHRDRLRQLMAEERAVRRSVNRFFDNQIAEIIDAMKAGNKAAGDDFWQKIEAGRGLTIDIEAIRRTANEALSQLIDWGKQDEALASVLLPAWEDAFNLGAKSIEQAFGIRAVQAPKLTDYLRQNGLRRVADINETTRDKLAQSIADGIEAGEGTSQLIERIQKHMPDVQAERAATIATSEAHTSMQAGSFEQMKFGGVRTKTWVTAGDSDVRDSHAGVNGETVPIDQRFSNGLMYPGDPSGAPGEIINCRCDMLPGDF